MPGKHSRKKSVRWFFSEEVAKRVICQAVRIPPFVGGLEEIGPKKGVKNSKILHPS